MASLGQGFPPGFDHRQTVRGLHVRMSRELHSGWAGVRDALKRLAMPARDIYHETVKNALIKDGWTITHDPLVLRWGTTDVYVGLGAEQLLAAEKRGQKIAVEIKSFVW